MAQFQLLLSRHSSGIPLVLFNSIILSFQALLFKLFRCSLPFLKRPEARCGGPPEGLFMEEFFHLIARLAGNVHAQLLEQVFVHMRQDDRRVGVAAVEAVHLLDGVRGRGVGDSADRQSDQQLVRMQARVVIAQMLHFEMLDRGNDVRRDQEAGFLNAREIFERVEQAGGGGAEQRSGFSGDHLPVFQFNGDRRSVRLLCAIQRGRNHRPVFRSDPQ